MSPANPTVSVPDIYFCESPGEVLVLDRQNIPPAKRAAIRGLHQLRYRYNLMIVAFAGLWAAAGSAVLMTPWLPLRVPGYFLGACALVGLTTLMHESNHNLLFRNRSLNRSVGFICGLPALVSVSAYHTLHLAHHAHTGTGRDPDSIQHSTPKSLPLVFSYYLVLVTGAYLYLGHVAIRGLRRADASRRRKILAEYSLIAVAVGIAFSTIPFNIMLNVWLIPLLISGQLSNVRGLAEHGLTASNNPFIDTRCVTSNRFVSLMMCNLNHHLDHHLFPGVPWYNLPRLHAMLEEEYRAAGASVYPSYTGFLVDFVKASRAGIVPDVRLIPEHLREDICA